MDSTSGSLAPQGPQSFRSRPSGGNLPSEVFGFPIAENQFNALQTVKPAESQRQLQREEGLVDPRTMRYLRIAAQRTEAQGILADGEIPATEPIDRDAQGTSISGTCVDPVVSRICSPFFTHSFSASPSDILSQQSVGPVHYSLGTGANVEDALYIEDVNDVACTDQSCNKRISDAGPERSAGRPGHTPSRRELACGKLIEDSCAGQDWSAGRPGNRPFGARSAACPSPITACSGPYGNALRQPHHTGPNTREETYIASSTTRGPRLPSTSQPEASSSRRPAAEDRASPATVALHPRRPPYFCGGLDEDVHVGTSIISRWLETIWGEPSTQMTFIVSLLRGATYDWYQHYETRTGCPGDWTTLRLAILKRFGTSICAEKAHAGIYQLKQDKMTVL